MTRPLGRYFAVADRGDDWTLNANTGESGG